jgi:hypothetical protein
MNNDSSNDNLDNPQAPENKNLSQTKKWSDFWLGMVLFLAMNFILWKVSSFVMQSPFIVSRDQVVYRSEIYILHLNFLISLVIFLICFIINCVIIVFFMLRKRPLIAVGMMTAAPAGYMLYLAYLFIVVTFAILAGAEIH